LLLLACLPSTGPRCWTVLDVAAALDAHGVVSGSEVVAIVEHYRGRPLNAPKPTPAELQERQQSEAEQTRLAEVERDYQRYLEARPALEAEWERLGL
jgi:hypothetical protein